MVIDMLSRVGRFFCKYKLWAVLFLPLGLLFSALARWFPDGTEHFYARGVYPLFVKSWGALTSLLPFSLGEILLYLFFAGLAVLLIAGVVQALRGKMTRRVIVTAACRILSTLSIIYMLFVLFCGLNYNRQEFAQSSGLEIRPSSVDELAALCGELIETANSQRALVGVDDEGVAVLAQDHRQTAELAQEAFTALHHQNSALFFDAPIKPKPVLASRGMSYTNITGIFFPFTLESNVNVDITLYEIPATMCHELAHTRGFMREDEANFIAYLACRISPSPDLQYSGTMLALVYSMNRLAVADYDKFAALAAGYSAGVRTDFDAANRYWKQFEGVAAELATKANDTYLKANDQVDGVQGYGRMVDLLLADYRSRQEKP